MTTTSRRLLTATAATFALGVAFSGAAFADAPTAASLTAPTLTYGGVGEPGNDGFGYEVSGAGCIGTEGTPGEVTVSLTDAAGNVSQPSTLTADAEGNWGGTLLVSGDIPAGTATVAASCDIYDQSINYPQGSVEVVGAVTPLPGIRADLSGTGNDTLTITIGGCIAADGTVGTISYAIAGPNGVSIEDTVTADSGGATSFTTAGTLGDWTADAICSVGGVVTNYAGFGFTISNTGSGSDSAVGDGTGTGTGSGSGTVDVSTDGSTVNVSVTTPTGSNAAGPQLANTGVEAAPYGLAAGALLVGGAALTLAGRRRTA